MFGGIRHELVSDQSNGLNRSRRDQILVSFHDDLSIQYGRKVVTQASQKCDARHLFCRIRVKVAMNLRYGCNAISS